MRSSAIASSAGAAATATGASQALATDGRSLDALRRSAERDPKSAAREAAKQFEALFTSELLKSMRASMDGGLMDNEASRMGTQMLDAQLSSQLSGRPGGLADVLARQLERQIGAVAAGTTGSASAQDLPGGTAAAEAARRGAPVSAAARASTGADRAVAAAGSSPATAQAADFVRQHTSAAQAAEAATGIPAEFMLAQSALETGWGRRAITGREGQASNNLFGIKAGAGWTGRTVDVTTTEYVDGRPQRLVQRFRAYDSTEESFADYARLMRGSPRYAQVLAAGSDARGFAQGLQRAGYATDPAYADKLGRVIDTTLRLQRAGTATVAGRTAAATGRDDS
ncbi:MAG: flagellar assembly peptidoglycan hydrolase FlgJ [Pseudomonadota bacterium]